MSTDNNSSLFRIGWESSAIADVADINPRHAADIPSSRKVSFIPMASIDESSWQFRQTETRSLGEVRSGYTHFVENDVLFAKITPCMENGKAAIATNLVNGLGCGTTEVHVIRPQSGIEPKYVYHYLHQESFRKAARQNMTGTAGQLRVPVDFLKHAEIPVPPTAEQQRIVEKLEKLLGNVNNCKDRLDKIPAILKRFRQSVLAAACSRRLTADWRELNQSDENWRAVKLSEVAHSRLGKMLDKAKNQGTPTPYLRNVNVRWFGFDLKDIQSIKVTKKEAEELSIQSGDVLICEGGEPGRCAIWRGESGKFVYQKALHRIRVGSRLLPEWTCYSLKNAADSGQLMNFFTGTTIKHLTGISLGQFQLYLPPLDEQHEIVRRVEALFKLADDIEKRYEKARAHVDKLTQSILAKAFRGELVPQDPNDEPASELLNRIRAERETRESESRAGRQGFRRRTRVSRGTSRAQ